MKLEEMSKYRDEPLYSKIDSMDLSQEAKLKFKKLYEIINETQFPTIYNVEQDMLMQTVLSQIKSSKKLPIVAF